MNKKEYMRKWTQENKEHVREYRERTKEKRNARRRELYAQDEWRRVAARKQAMEWQRANQDKRKAQRLKQYQVTLAEFQTLLEKQGSQCAICGHADMSNPNIFPVVDHCHATGKVRGILCLNCNHGLGKFMDNPRLLKKASTYLKNNG